MNTEKLSPSLEKPPVDPGCLPAWKVEEMPAPAPLAWNNLLALIGPGLVLAGSTLGTGEWITGAAIAAIYRGLMLWVAPVAVLCQVILNTEVMRYTLVTGEPIFTGFMRSKPGPKFWLAWYILLDCMSWWPTLAGLTAQILLFTLYGTNAPLNPDTLRWVSCGILILCGLLLCFGGKVYNTLEVVLGGKVLFVLGYMTFVTILFVPWNTWTEVVGNVFNPFKMPEEVEWSLVGAAVGFAGIGGLGNILASNYVREKGWGMGAKVGAIASAFGGHQISLSHIGSMAAPTEENVRRFQGWWKTIARDQYGLWVPGSLIGMLLPCMLGAEYLKGDYFHGVEQWKAAVALAEDFGAVRGEIFTKLTLLCGFIIMAPGQFSSMDGLARRWCDAIWSGTKWAHHAQPHKVKHLYYTLIFAYVVWGCLINLRNISPPTMMLISGNLGNLTLASCLLHTLYVNWRFLPKPFQPTPAKRVMMVLAAGFYLLILSKTLPGTLEKLMNAVG